MDWPTFRDGSLDVVRAVAPQTIILAAGGTRRDAILHAPEPDRWEKAFRWSILEGVQVYQRWFEAGVQDLFTCLIRSTQMREQGTYGRRLLLYAEHILNDLANQWTADPPPFAVHTIGHEWFPSLEAVLTQIRNVTAGLAGRNRVWWTFFDTPQRPYTFAINAIASHQVRSAADAIAVLYGPDVKPCQLYIGFGKPILSPELQLPFLIDEDEAQALWYQTPGYTGLTPQLIRRIIYEYAYVRSTWVADKELRYREVAANRSTWEQGHVLGLGSMFGDFWYPEQHGTQEGEAT
jgi:hypothetical protein